MTNEEKKKKTIKNPLLNATMLIIAMVFLALTTFSYRYYRKSVIEERQARAGDAIEYIGETIEGAMLQEYVETRIESENTANIRQMFSLFEKTHGLESIYLVVAEEGSARQILTSKDIDLSRFSDETLQKIDQRMDKKHYATFIQDDAFLSDLYIAVRPVYDDHGNPIALLCANVHVGSSVEALVYFVFFSLVTAFAASVILLLVFESWLDKRVVAPLWMLQNAIAGFENKFHRGAGPEELVIGDPGVHTDDEMEVLANYIVSMSNDVRQYAIDLSKKTDEIEDMKEHVSEMDEIAFTDSLTGGANKAAYVKAMERLDWEISLNIAKFAIVMADLNYLKRTNDTYGHEKGNLYIIYNYNLLKQAFFTSKIYRIGGDEFVVIIKDKALQKLEKSLAVIQEKMQKTWNDPELQAWEKLSSAIGSAVYDPLIDKSADDVFKRADEDMYADKKRMHAGRE